MTQSNLGKIRNKDGTIPNHHVLMGGVGQGICARVDQMLHRIRNSDVERYAKDIQSTFGDIFARKRLIGGIREKARGCGIVEAQSVL